MRRLDLNEKKKLRGLKRHLKNFEKSMDVLETTSIERWNDSYEYGSQKINIHQKLLSHRDKTTKYILNKYIEASYKCYLNNKNKGWAFSLILNYPEIFTSRVCLSYTQEHFKSLQDRDYECQKWIKQKTGIVELLNLSIPKNCQVKNYKESFIEDGVTVYEGIVTIIVFYVKQ